MRSRANWKGFLKVDSLSCPVALYSVVSTSERIAFHKINRATGPRVRHEYIDGESERPAPVEDQVKGYEAGQDDYVLLEAEEAASAAPKSDKTLSVSAFVSWAEVDEVYFERPYYPTPSELGAQESRQLRLLRPETVAEVEFRAWTADALLRHASFRGLREDKDAREIKREAPEGAEPSKGRRGAMKLTHPDRLYWPEQGVTKEGLANYYVEMWRHIAPFVVGRPLALLRCPTGLHGQQFFQKHAWKGLNPAIRLVRDPKAPAEEPLISIEDLEGLLGLVQAAALEIHPWGATLEDWERPDTLTLDLDPGDGVAWDLIVAAAREAADRLKAAGLAAFVKTTGGRGLHVVAPLRPQAGWSEAKDFTRGIAESMAADSPGRFVATIAKAKRRGKILIDYLRNQRGATAIAAYSTRARPGAPVSMPLAWDELGPAIGPNHYTVENAPKRLAALAADPWEDFRAAAAPLEAKTRRRKSPA